MKNPPKETSDMALILVMPFGTFLNVSPPQLSEDLGVSAGKAQWLTSGISEAPASATQRILAANQGVVEAFTVFAVLSHFMKRTKPAE